MYIKDYLRSREGYEWEPEDTAEVMRIVAKIEKTALAVAKLRGADESRQRLSKPSTAKRKHGKA